MKITLRLSTKTDAEGRSEVLLSCKKKVGDKVITMYAKSEVYTLTVFFDGRDIDLNKKRTIAPDVRKFHTAMKDKLQGLLKAIDDACINTPKDGFTVEWLKQTVQAYLHPVTADNGNFFKLFEEYLNIHGFAPLSLNTRQSLKRAVFRFVRYRQLAEDPTYTFSPLTVDKEDIEDFENYLIHEVELMNESPAIFNTVIMEQVEKYGGSTTVKEKGVNAVVSFLNNLKSFFSWAQKHRGLKNNPFEGVEIKRQTWGNVVYPTLEERNTIYSTPMPSPMLTKVRDAWILQSVLGCRVGDLMSLSEDNITDGTLKYTPHKTKDETGSFAIVPLNNLAKEIIAKYRGQDRKGRLMPFPSTTCMNENIKKVFEIAGVNRKVEVRDPLTGENVLKPISIIASTHMARRCFIGNIYKEVQDPNLICKMSGHVEGSKSFARYRKVEEDTLKAVVAKIDKPSTDTPTTSDMGAIAARLADLSPDKLAAVMAIINFSK